MSRIGNIFRQKLTKEMLTEVEEGFFSICDKETGAITRQQLICLLTSLGMDQGLEQIVDKGRAALVSCGLATPVDENASAASAISGEDAAGGETETATVTAASSSSAIDTSTTSNLTSSVTIDVDFVVMLISYIMEGSSAWCDSELEESFHVFDKDMRGFLDPSELKRVFTMLGENLTEQELLTQIAEFDIDGDRQMQLEEWTRMISSTKGIDYVFDE